MKGLGLDPRKEPDFFKAMLSSQRFRKHITQRLICFGVLFIVWLYINGGLLPFFLRQKIPMLKIGTEANILTFFSGTEDDGVNIKWAHAVNTAAQLERALDSHEIHMIEADVMLRGQGTDKQTLIPVMAQHPATDGTMTFDEWLDMVIKSGRKGIKIDFQSNDAIEITLQKMKDRKSQIVVPVWFHADVLKGPLGGEPRVDPTRFVKNVKRLFPECSLSFGWTTGTHTDLSQAGYTWNMVMDMYYLVDKLELEPLIVFTARASFITNSVPQLKWLTDNTRASLLVWQSPEDKHIASHADLMYICYRFPPHHAFFDLHDEELAGYLLENRLNSGPKVSQLVKIRDTNLFRAEAWVKMGFFIEAHSILPSSEAIVLTSRAVYMVTKAKYKPSSTLMLKGRVQFLNRKSLKAEEGKTGLSIFLRSTSYIDYENIKGIQCFISIDGQIHVSSSHLSTEIHKTAHITPGSADCFRFTVKDTGKEIIFTVATMHDCSTLESAKPDDRPAAVLQVPVSSSIGGLDDEHPFIVKLEDSKRTAVIDELTVKYTTT